MLSGDIKNLKDRYQNGSDRYGAGQRDNIGRDLMVPCLREAKLYRRGTGFFSSSALKSYVEVLDRMINEDIKIEILCSPVVKDRALLRTLEHSKNDEERAKTLRNLSDQVMLIAAGYKANQDRPDYAAKLLSYLIASGKLEVRFAVPKKFDEINHLESEEDVENQRNLYHVKLGYFKFPDGEIVAFDGSFNESDSGLRHHSDRTTVFKSWEIEDTKRVRGIVEDIDADWNGSNDSIMVYELSPNALEIIKKCSPQERPRRQQKEEKPIVDEIDRNEVGLVKLWPHQEAAVQAFLEEKRGILEMATGTGKTTTALEIVKRLYLSNQIESAIVITYGNALLEQWTNAIEKWAGADVSLHGMALKRLFSKYNEIDQYIFSPQNKFLVTSRTPSRISEILRNLVNPEKTIVIHDEIHGFGSKGNLSIEGAHKKIVYTLGLSATPEREYDDVGTTFIENEIGPVIYKYELSNAIEDGILCEFDYLPVMFELTPSDIEKRRSVFSRKAAAEREGNPWTEEQLYQELAKVVKKAEMKPVFFDELLSAKPGLLKSSIVYAFDQEQGDELATIISRYTNRYKTFYEGTDLLHLNQLEMGNVDVVVALERLNEGIDIPSLKTVFLVSSDRARLKTIQRIGRCLRLDKNDPNKKALVVDFVLDEEGTADAERMNWLQKISQSRTKK